MAVMSGLDREVTPRGTGFTSQQSRLTPLIVLNRSLGMQDPNLLVVWEPPSV